MLLSAQIRAARALLGWEQKDLSKAAGVSLPTIKRIEKLTGKVSAYTGTMEATQKTPEVGGVEFTNDDAPGVRLKRRG